MLGLALLAGVPAVILASGFYCAILLCAIALHALLPAIPLVNAFVTLFILGLGGPWLAAVLIIELGRRQAKREEPLRQQRALTKQVLEERHPHARAVALSSGRWMLVSRETGRTLDEIDA